MKTDIYHTSEALETYIKTIKEDNGISERNKGFILDFRDHCILTNITKVRILKYMGHLRLIAKWLGVDFDKATRKDLERLIIYIESQAYALNTIYDYKVCIKKFYKWLDKSGDETPERVRWIKTNSKKSRKKLPEDILSKEDVKAMIGASCNPRDACIISLLAESGIRIGECLKMTIRNIEFDQYGAKVKIQGKTGHRLVRVISSVPYLANWLNNHPFRNDPDGFVWISVGTKNHHKLMGYQSVVKMLREVAKKAGVTKHVNPHAFRHHAASHLANKLTEAQLCEYFGWKYGSDIPQIYVHLSGRNVDSAILEMHGYAKNKDIDNLLEPKTCFICKNINRSDDKFCSRCGHPLDERTAIEAKEKEKGAMNLITPQIIEQMINRKVEELIGKLQKGS